MKDCRTLGLFDSLSSESELSELVELSEDELSEDVLPEDVLPDALSAVSNLFSDSELLSLSFDNFKHVFSPLLAFRSGVWPVGETTSSLFLFPAFAGVISPFVPGNHCPFPLFSSPLIPPNISRLLRLRAGTSPWLNLNGTWILGAAGLSRGCRTPSCCVREAGMEPTMPLAWLYWAASFRPINYSL